jgi:endonuclease/exonuclease/phosphatase family metal-dependent hydrolase
MAPQQLKILSYNIHKGFSLGNLSFKLSAIREAVRDVHPDLVFLQEVQGEHRHFQARISAWPEAAQFEFMADQFWPHYAYGKNAVYDAGHHGNAILSKFPFSHWENIDVSASRFERRGILHGVIPIPGQPHPLHVLCLHLDLFEAGRQSQIQSLCRRLEESVPEDHPVIIAGDFNDWRIRATETLTTRARLKEVFFQLEGRHARTFPAWRPLLPLDRVYFRGLSARSAYLPRGRHWNALSDHLPVCCEFSL